MRFKLSNLVFLVLIFSFLSVSCGEKDKQAEPGKSKNATKSKKAELEKEIPVRVKSIIAENLVKVVETSGIITSDYDVTVLSETAGKIVQVEVELGQKVKKGDTMVKVDTEPYYIALNASQAQYDQAAVAFNQAEVEFNRAKSLHESNNISDQAFDTAKFSFERSKAALAASKAALDKARRDLRLTSVRAPFDGEVAARAVKLGDALAMGSPVAQIVNRDKLKIKVGLSEDDISGIKIGQVADITIPTLNNGETVPGNVLTVGVKAIQPTMTYPVEIEIKEPSDTMRVGMVARAAIHMDSGRKAIVLPLEKLVDRFDRYYVYVVKDKKAEERLVKLGAKQGRTVEILEGLKEGDVMVIEGQSNLKDGSKLQIVE